MGLFQPAWMSKHEEKALMALSKLNTREHKAEIERAARTATLPAVRLTAIRRCYDAPLLREAALHDPDAAIRSAAVLQRPKLLLDHPGLIDCVANRSELIEALKKSYYEDADGRAFIPLMAEQGVIVDVAKEASHARYYDSLNEIWEKKQRELIAVIAKLPEGRQLLLRLLKEGDRIARSEANKWIRETRAAGINDPDDPGNWFSLVRDAYETERIMTESELVWWWTVGDRKRHARALNTFLRERKERKIALAFVPNLQTELLEDETLVWLLKEAEPKIRQRICNALILRDHEKNIRHVRPYLQELISGSVDNGVIELLDDETLAQLLEDAGRATRSQMCDVLMQRDYEKNIRHVRPYLQELLDNSHNSGQATHYLCEFAAHGEPAALERAAKKLNCRADCGGLALVEEALFRLDKLNARYGNEVKGSKAGDVLAECRFLISLLAAFYRAGDEAVKSKLRAHGSVKSPHFDTPYLSDCFPHNDANGGAAAFN